VKLAIVDNWGMLATYESEFSKYSPDLFDSYTSFLDSRALYDVLIFAHRLSGFDWETAYKQLQNKPRVIVTSTFPLDYYKTYEALETYDKIQAVNKYKNCIFATKDDYKNIRRSIEIEYYFNALMSV
jgi:hypothetical protein